MKEVVAVSACLLGENCKYNGGNNYNGSLCRWLEDKTVVPVCPETFGKLPIPRVPSELVDGVATSKDGVNVDEEFRLGAQKALDVVRKNNAEIVILQSRSPSCGVNEIYDGSFSGKKIRGQGVFAKLLIEEGYKVMDIEDFEA